MRETDERFKYFDSIKHDLQKGFSISMEGKALSNSYMLEFMKGSKSQSEMWDRFDVIESMAIHMIADSILNRVVIVNQLPPAVLKEFFGIDNFASYEKDMVAYYSQKVKELAELHLEEYRKGNITAEINLQDKES